MWMGIWMSNKLTTKLKLFNVPGHIASKRIFVDPINKSVNANIVIKYVKYSWNFI